MLCFSREAPMIGRKLVQYGERLAVPGHDTEDRAFPGQDVGVKIGDELEKIGLRERESIIAFEIHHFAHEPEAVVACRGSEKGHS